MPLGLEDYFEIGLVIFAFIFIVCIAISVLRMDDTDAKRISEMQERDAERLFTPDKEVME